MRSRPRGPGWVYILTNPGLPGCCKIGGSSRTARDRARELMAEYGTSAPFSIAVRPVPTADWFAVEQAAHRMLADRRLPRSELFEVSPREARRVVHAAAAAYARPWSPVVLLRRLVMPETGPARLSYRPRYRRGTNWLPLLLVVSAVVALVAIVKPVPPSWMPPPIARTMELVERL